MPGLLEVYTVIDLFKNKASNSKIITSSNEFHSITKHSGMLYVNLINF